MSISYYDKSGDEPVKILLAGTSATDLLLDPNSTNAIANRAVYVALSEKVDIAVRNLLYYYTKEQVFTKEEVQNLIGTISTMDIRVVSDLPTTNISTNTIYFLESALTEGAYDQYVYIQGSWVKIGDTEADLSQYLKNEDFAIKIADYYTKDQIIANYYTKTQIDTAMNNKQDKLTFDSAPTANSNNPVTSGGVKAAIDAISISGGGSGGSNPNILDNAFFQVNQLYGAESGITQETSMTFNASHGGLTTIDRWWFQLGGNGHMVHYKNYYGTGPRLAIDSSTQYGRIEQRIPKDKGDYLIGKKVVMSAIVTSPDATKIRLRFGRASNSTPLENSQDYIVYDFDIPAGSDHKLIQSTPITIQSTTSSYSYYNFLLYPQFTGGTASRTGVNVFIHAVKLEISNTGSTLANDPLPDYETELLKCQRYKYVVRGSYAGGDIFFASGGGSGSSSFKAMINTPVTMAYRPRVTFTGTHFVLWRPGGTTTSVNSGAFSADNLPITSTMISFTVSVTSTANATYYIGMSNQDSKVVLDCENGFSSNKMDH